MDKLIFLPVIFLCLIIDPGHVWGQDPSQNQEDITLHMVGHAHIDPVYRWRWNEIRDRNLEFTFNRVLDVMDQYPDFYFSQSQLLFYEAVKDNNPDLFKKIKKRIKEGRWTVVGGQWVEPDEVLTSGESLIRQFLVGHDFYNRHLGIEDIDIAWAPDAFTGHANTIPQIYNGCGIKYYVYARGTLNNKRVFWWQGPDESNIMAYKNPGHYMGDVENFADTARSWNSITNYNQVMKTFGEGDHGGGPQPEKIERLVELGETEDGLDVAFSSSREYFQDIPDDRERWPEYQSELGLNFRGAYTSNTAVKRANRKLENELLIAEKFASIGGIYHRKPFHPRQDFLEAWKILLKNQAHDILPGTMVSLAADDAMEDYRKLEEKVKSLQTYGMELIGSRIDTRMEGKPLVIYNPHSWELSDYVQAQIRFIEKPGNFKILDPDQKEVPYQINSWSEDSLKANITLQAQEVPGAGYKAYQVLQKTPSKAGTDLRVQNQRIENEFYRIEWDDKGLTGIYSKKLERELLKSTGNALQLMEEKAGSSSTWSLNLTGKEFPLNSITPPEVTRQSPLQVTVKWEDRSRSSKFVRKMTVKAGSPEIEFDMEVDWHENNKLLRVAFPVDVDEGEAFYEQPYGYIQRPLSDQENPAQKWVDLSNDAYGVSLINNGKNGFVINDQSIKMSVVRGPQGMDPRMDEGVHRFGYSLVVHEGDWKAADIPKKALVFNQELKAMQENYHSGETNAWYTGNTTLPLEKSFYSIDSDHVIISSIKIKRDEFNPSPIVLRIFETEGRSEDVTVNLPGNPREIVECNHIEEPIEPKSDIRQDGEQFTFEIGHNQIRTFLLKY